MNALLLDLLVDNFFLAMSLWLALMVSDNLLSFWSVKLYRQGAKDHMVLEDGSEINIFFRDDVVHQRIFSPFFVFVISITYLMAWLVWSYSLYSAPGKGIFEFFLGLIILIHLPLHLRHARNLLSFHYLRLSHGVEGRIKFASWLTARLTVITLLSASLVYIALFFFSQRVFFLGGALSCAMLAYGQWNKGDYLPKERGEYQDHG